MDYLKEVSSIKVNKLGQVISLHKPLLLLLTIAEIVHGKPNLFKYKELEESLIRVLQKYGLKYTKKINPQYPFIYLNSSPEIWKCSIQKSDLKNPDAASRNDLLSASATFAEGFYDFLMEPMNAKNGVWQILNEYWTEAYHEDILLDLGLDTMLNEYTAFKNIDKRRGRLFVQEVLDAYERQCAICRQSIRLGDSLLGIDACHVKPIQHFGPDIVNNGIALCKMHHWAMDRGAISLTHDFKVIVSSKLNGSKSEQFFHEYSKREVFIPRIDSKALNSDHVKYHFDYIFQK